VHVSGAMADENPRWLLVDEPEPEVTVPAELRWRRLVRALLLHAPAELRWRRLVRALLLHAPAEWRSLARALFHIRRLQRLWGYLGSFLQTIDKDLRKRLQAKITLTDGAVQSTARR
jgi:hypothetical protein